MNKLILTVLFSVFSLFGFSQTWKTNGDNSTSGSLTIGSTTDNSESKFIIRGPNQPYNLDSKRDISFDFYYAGKSIIRSYRGKSWDTYLQFLTSNVNNNGGEPEVRMHINQDGKVGIGTTSPYGVLHLNEVNGLSADSENNILVISNGETEKNIGGKYGIRFKASTYNHNKGSAIYNVSESTWSNVNGLAFHTSSNSASAPIERVRIKGNGEVGIGTTNTSGYKLSVNGKIRATEVKVYTGWADYVFKEDYKLKSLEEVEAHIKEHKHLPDVPSAKEVEENGVNLGESDAVLLRKIEELTLYLIEMQKELDKQKVLNETYLKRIEKLEQE